MIVKSSRTFVSSSTQQRGHCVPVPRPSLGHQRGVSCTQWSQSPHCTGQWSAVSGPTCTRGPGVHTGAPLQQQRYHLPVAQAAVRPQQAGSGGGARLCAAAGVRPRQRGSDVLRGEGEQQSRQVPGSYPALALDVEEAAASFPHEVAMEAAQEAAPGLGRWVSGVPASDVVTDSRR